MARRAGCGVAANGGVIDGCCAAYTTSVTFGDSFSSRRSLCASGAVNNNLHHDTLTCLRIAEIAPFSNLDTCAWEMPRLRATSIWVLPS